MATLKFYLPLLLVDFYVFKPYIIYDIGSGLSVTQ